MQDEALSSSEGFQAIGADFSPESLIRDAIDVTSFLHELLDRDENDLGELLEAWVRGWRVRSDLEVASFADAAFESRTLELLPSVQSAQKRVSGRIDRVLSIGASDPVFTPEVLTLAEDERLTLEGDGPSLVLRHAILDNALAELGRFLGRESPRPQLHPLRDLLRRLERYRFLDSGDEKVEATLLDQEKRVRRALMERCLEEHSTHEEQATLSVQARLLHETRLIQMYLHTLGCLSCDDPMALGVLSRMTRIHEEVERELVDTNPLDVLSGLAPWENNLLDIAEEELAKAHDRPAEQALATLSLLRERATWFLCRLKEAEADVLKKRQGSTASLDLGTRKRRLRRLGRRLRAEIQDRHVKNRLIQVLGPRGAAFLDWSILILILTACSMIVLDLFFNVSGHSTEQAVAEASSLEDSFSVRAEDITVFRAIDLTICFIFLAEFFLKFCLAKQRGLYFSRHFFTEFLPSIPFLFYMRPLRALRLARLMRYFRVVIFAVRGMDRIAHRLSRLLHWNIVFFDPPPNGQENAGNCVHLENLLRTRLRVSARGRVLRSLLSPEEQQSVGHWQVDHFEDQIGAVSLIVHEEEIQVAGSLLFRCEAELTLGEGETSTSDSMTLTPSENREVRFEQVIRKLVTLDPIEVEEVLGPGMCGKIARVVRALNTPLLRHLPLISAIARSVHDDIFMTTAEAGRALGRLLQRGLSIVQWFADLHGVVTGPQFVDRVGTGLAASSRRPAVRLLLLGFLFLILRGIVEFLDIDDGPLRSIVNFLSDSLGIAIVVLGVVCLVIHVFGLWLRRLAGEATDVYEKTAEAQFSNLLKVGKSRMAGRDALLLQRRILSREPAFQIWPMTLKSEGKEEGDDGMPGDVIALRERIRLLYRDYLDGALLHKSDVKTTEHLLGNVSLENIRMERLSFTRKDKKRIRKLDLARERSFGGPYFWFRSMFTAIEQQTAKLLIDYNRNCIPISQQKKASKEAMAKYRAFLRGERTTGRGKEDRKALNKERKAFLRFETTDFNALHFLGMDEEREKGIEKRFGKEVRSKLRRDRRQMIRRTFGTYPFHGLPRRERVVNAHELYLSYVRGGRVIFMPLWLFLLASRGGLWVIRHIARMVKELIDPQLASSLFSLPVDAPFEVAVRKINRMRKPVFMECVRFRARFDPEYMGFPAPGVSPGPGGDVTYVDDLDFIGSMVDEVRELEALEARVEKSHVHFQAFLTRMGWMGEGFSPYLRAIDEDLPGRRDEALRALWIGFVINYRQLSTLITAPAFIRSAIDDVLSGTKGSSSRFRLSTRFSSWRFPVPYFRRRRRIALALEGFCTENGYEDLSETQREDCIRRCLAEPELGKAILSLHFVGGVKKAEGRIASTVQAVVKNHVAWTRQLVTLRTVQTLAVLDVKNDRRVVFDLGGYAEDGELDPDRRASLEAAGEIHC